MAAALPFATGQDKLPSKTLASSITSMMYAAFLCSSTLVLSGGISLTCMYIQVVALVCVYFLSESHDPYLFSLVMGLPLESLASIKTRNVYPRAT